MQTATAEKVGKGLYRPPLGPKATIRDLFDFSLGGEYLSWEQKAKYAGLSPSTLRNWESGRQIPKLNAREFAQLCRFLGVSFEEFSAAVDETLKRTGGLWCND